MLKKGKKLMALATLLMMTLFAVGCGEEQLIPMEMIQAQLARVQSDYCSLNGLVPEQRPM